MKNNKLIVGVIIAILVLGVGAFIFNKSMNGNSQSQNMPSNTNTQLQPTPSVMTTTTPTTPTPSAMMTTTPTPTSSSQKMTSKSVSIQNMAFSPATLIIKVGDQVTWTNQDSIGHSATADDGSFDTGIISQGQSGSNTFTKAGTYTYHCSVHPSMTATIVVQ